MTAQLDVNSLASWAAVVAAVGGAFGVHRKATRWFDSVDKRFEDGRDRFKTIDESLITIKTEQAAIKEEQAETKERVAAIDAQLRPNGGGSHHDVLRREIREAIEEAAEGSGRRHWRR